MWKATESAVLSVCCAALLELREQAGKKCDWLVLLVLREARDSLHPPWLAVTDRLMELRVI